MNIIINPERLNGQGWAGFVKGSAKEGKAIIKVDIDAMLNCCIEEKEIKFKQLFSESIVHEILHVVQELFDETFDEDQVEQAILKCRKK
jgi:hypothetical protein